MQDPLEASRAVNGCCLIQAGIDRRHGGNVDDGTPADFLPDVDHADQPPEIFAFSEEEYRFLYQAQRHQQFVNGTIAGEKVLRHTDHDNHGQEVRQIGHGLHRAFEFPVAHLVEKHCQQHGSHRAKDQIDHAHGQCIPDTVEEILTAEQPFKVLQSDPFAARDAQLRFVVLERRDPEIHRVIIEEKNIQEHRHGHDQQLPLGAQGSEEAPVPARFQFLPAALRDTGHGHKPLSEKTMGRDIPLPMARESVIICCPEPCGPR